MKKAQVRVGGLYAAKVSGRVVVVRVRCASPHGGWIATSVATGRDVRVRTAARLRHECVRDEATGRYRPVESGEPRPREPEEAPCPVQAADMADVDAEIDAYEALRGGES